MNKKGQVSLEYLLIFAAFFAGLGVMLPSISYSVDSFFSANDVFLAKSIAQQVQEQENMFRFLADGSSNKLEFFPAKKISVHSQGTDLVITGGGKEFHVNLSTPRLIIAQDFNSRFFVELNKRSGSTQITFKKP